MDDAAFNTESVAADQLKAFIERIERLEEEKAGIAGDIKDVYAEAKGNGFDTKVLRKIISLRKRDYAERSGGEGNPQSGAAPWIPSRTSCAGDDIGAPHRIGMAGTTP